MCLFSWKNGVLSTISLACMMLRGLPVRSKSSGKVVRASLLEGAGREGWHGLNGPDHGPGPYSIECLFGEEYG